MEIVQLNKENSFGFVRLENTDIGQDEKGELAQGFQYHDGLWWAGSPSATINSKPCLDEMIRFFTNVFTLLAKKIVDNFKPKMVLELGSGSGQLCYLLRQLDSNIVTVTVDANQDTVKSPYVDKNHFIARTDKFLDFVNNNERVKFDLVISLEHLEHISPNTCDVFIKNILQHTKFGSIFMASAATFPYPEDKKHIHCNLQSKQSWLNYLFKFGFEEFAAPFEIQRGGNEIFVKNATQPELLIL